MEGGFTQPAGAAELRFRGLWLRQAGFHPGATFSLTNPEPGVLQLRVNGPAQLTTNDFQAVIQNFKNLGI
jgi:hypothetical protein